MSLGIYLHFPYCHQKCNYCDFYSLGHADSVPQAYVDALLARIAAAQAAPGWCRPETVYFGGGTPSLLAPAQALQLLTALDPLPGAEITLEANPGTVTRQSLAAFRAAGVNRLSLGVQTAYDDSLKRLGRIHTAADARRAMTDAAAAGFTNISGDVMLALPQYSQAELDATLDLLADGGCTHISCYLLKIEPGTPFGRTPPQNLPDEDAAAAFYTACVAGCAARGYAQYEISNFARPGNQSLHNLRYWDCKDYLGLGPAAHSCVAGQRFYYPADLHAFLAGAQPVADGQCTAEDYIMLQLRLNQGLDLAALQRDWGHTFDSGRLDFMRKCAQNALATFDGSTFALTTAGMLVQNSILCELI